MHLFSNLFNGYNSLSNGSDNTYSGESTLPKDIDIEQFPVKGQSSKVTKSTHRATGQATNSNADNDVESEKMISTAADLEEGSSRKEEGQKGVFGRVRSVFTSISNVAKDTFNSAAEFTNYAKSFPHSVNEFVQEHPYVTIGGVVFAATIMGGYAYYTIVANNLLHIPQSTMLGTIAPPVTTFPSTAGTITQTVTAKGIVVFDNLGPLAAAKTIEALGGVVTTGATGATAATVLGGGATGATAATGAAATAVGSTAAAAYVTHKNISNNATSSFIPETTTLPYRVTTGGQNGTNSASFSTQPVYNPYYTRGPAQEISTQALPNVTREWSNNFVLHPPSEIHFSEDAIQSQSISAEYGNNTNIYWEKREVNGTNYQRIPDASGIEFKINPRAHEIENGTQIRAVFTDNDGKAVMITDPTTVYKDPVTNTDLTQASLEFDGKKLYLVNYQGDGDIVWLECPKTEVNGTNSTIANWPWKPVAEGARTLDADLENNYYIVLPSSSIEYPNASLSRRPRAARGRGGQPRTPVHIKPRPKDGIRTGGIPTQGSLPEAIIAPSTVPFTIFQLPRLIKYGEDGKPVKTPLPCGTDNKTNNCVEITPKLSTTETAGTTYKKVRVPCGEQVTVIGWPERHSKKIRIYASTNGKDFHLLYGSKKGGDYNSSDCWGNTMFVGGPTDFGLDPSPLNRDYVPFETNLQVVSDYSLIIETPRYDELIKYRLDLKPTNCSSRTTVRTVDMSEEVMAVEVGEPVLVPVQFGSNGKPVEKIYYAVNPENYSQINFDKPVPGIELVRANNSTSGFVKMVPPRNGTLKINDKKLSIQISPSNTMTEEECLRDLAMAKGLNGSKSNINDIADCNARKPTTPTTTTTRLTPPREPDLNDDKYLFYNKVLNLKKQLPYASNTTIWNILKTYGKEEYEWIVRDTIAYQEAMEKYNADLARYNQWLADQQPSTTTTTTTPAPPEMSDLVRLYYSLIEGTNSTYANQLFEKMSSEQFVKEYNEYQNAVKAYEEQFGPIMTPLVRLYYSLIEGTNSTYANQLFEKMSSEQFVKEYNEYQNKVKAREERIKARSETTTTTGSTTTTTSTTTPAPPRMPDLVKLYYERIQGKNETEAANIYKRMLRHPKFAEQYQKYQNELKAYEERMKARS